jgi:3-oxosteroid 1-dehydrogenase
MGAEQPGWDSEVDILVVGSGAGALTAAVVAADARAKVAVIEKSALFGGTSATSGGVLWIPNSPIADPALHQDSPEEAMTYITALTEGTVPEARIRAFVDNAPRMLAYMIEHSEVRYTAIPYTDYHAELPGGKVGYRSHEATPLDGRLLGRDLANLRPTHVSQMLFGRMSWTSSEASPMIARSKGWIGKLLKVTGRYYLDIGERMRSSRSRYLVCGNALVARLKLSLDKRDVAIQRSTRLISLISQGGAVIGAEVEHDGRRHRIRARRGVILGAGGFERNPRLRAQHLTRTANTEWSGAQPNNTGDALAAAQAVGAATARLGSAWWAPTIKVPGEESARPLFFERSLPGSIIINQIGRRFMNEAASYHIVGREMMEKNLPDAPTSPSWVLFDARFHWRYPMGPMMPMIPDFLHPKAVRQMLVKARNWDEMADKLGIERAVLRDTITRFNANAREGVDPDYGRGHQPYDRFYGDPKVTPNPNLLPLERAPFYALPIYPGDIGTNGGLVTDENAQVLDTDGIPIGGLYAIGNTAASVMGPSYPGAGATIGPAMTFGFVAARHAMRVNL